ncbi:MAG: hypothetical protein B7Y02_07110, partial [Rhodobacterales bacterium 17-64-5]
MADRVFRRRDMTTSDALHDEVRARIKAEFEHGFPLMMPVPSTPVIQLIDFASALSAAESAALQSEIAAGTVRVLQGEAFGVIGRGGVYDRFYHAVKSGPSPFNGGPRYSAVRFLASTPLSAMPGSAKPPRPDLLPDVKAVVPATSRMLKLRVTAALKAAGYEAHKGFGGGIRFLSPSGTLLDFDFGARVDQLRFGVAIRAARFVNAPLAGGPLFHAPGSFFGFYGSNWDYVT